MKPAHPSLQHCKLPILTVAKDQITRTMANTDVITPELQGDDTALVENFRISKPGLKVEVFSSPDRVLQVGAGDTYVIPGFLSEQEADEAFNFLNADHTGKGKEIQYQQWYHMPDAKKEKKGHTEIPLRPLTRVKVAQADPLPDGTLPYYRFPVNQQSKFGTTPFTPTVKRVLEKVKAWLQEDSPGGSLTRPFELNHAVILLYRGAKDRIGLHKDKLLDLNEGAPIVSVSLGQARVYVLQDDLHNPTRRQEITLPHGSLVVLGPKTNQAWYHSIRSMSDEEIESSSGASQNRVSMTFRAAASLLNPEKGEIIGKGDNYQTADWPVELRGAHRPHNDQLARE